MSNTFCGRSCSECSYKVRLSCQGCSSGAGAVGPGDCVIAKCCQKNGLTVCEDCIWHGECSTLGKKDDAPRERVDRKKKEAFEARKERNYRSLAKWLPISFWLVIGSVVLSFFSGEEILEQIPSIKWPVIGLATLADIAYALILLRVSDSSDRYRYAGIGGLMCAALGLVAQIFAGAGWSWAITLVAMLPSFIKEFQEHLGHADVVEALDADLAEKWRGLWLWRFGFMMTLALCLPLAFILTVTASFLTLIAAIGLIVVSVIKIVYIHKTSSVFVGRQAYYG